MRTVVTYLIFVVLAPSAAPLLSQENPIEYRIIPVEHVRPSDMAQVFGGWTQVKPINSLKVLAVTGKPEILDKIAAEVRRLDQPTSPASLGAENANARITVHIIAATSSLPSKKPGARVAEAIQELQKAFPDQSYSLIETFSVLASPGNEQFVNSGVLPGDVGEASVPYQFSFYVHDVRGERPNRAAVLDQVSWSITIRHPGGSARDNYQEPIDRLEIRSGAVNVPEGKLLILGKTGARGPADGFVLAIESEITE